MRIHIYYLCFIFSLLSCSNIERDLLIVSIKDSKNVNPIKYGWHYEEIGMIGEGGLYAEMVRNRGMEEANPPGGLVVKDGIYANVPNPRGGSRKEVYKVDPFIGWKKYPHETQSIQVGRVNSFPLNKQNPHSLQIQIEELGSKVDAGVMNKGFFGMLFKEGVQYHLSFYARAENFSGPLEVILSDSLGVNISNSFHLSTVDPEWKKYTVMLTANKTTRNGRLYFKPASAGKIWLDMVSLFPGDTWDQGKSIFRSDIMQNLKDYAPDFIRFPGGCLVHGVNVETMYNWKETIGDIAQRPGGWSKWTPNYRTDGLGYHEFYELCEYLNADAMYVTPSGLVCTGWVFQEGKSDHYHHPQVDVQHYIQDALDAIEYAIGPVDSQWGSERAKNGHPEPFPLKYIEIGNEDFGPRYYENYDAIYRAIHERYPDLKIITNSIIGQAPGRDAKRERLIDFIDLSTISIFDEHYYKDISWIIDNFYKFDQYERPGPDLFIGELGIGEKYPLDALGEAVFMMNMERNGDLNPLIADRPLMRNWTFVKGKGNPLLFHTNSTSFKTFNFYMSKLFRDNKIDKYYTSSYYHSGEVASEISTEYLFSTVGKNSESGELVIKVVNLTSNTRNVNIKFDQEIQASDVKLTTLTAKTDQKNTPERPDTVLPVTEKLMNLPRSYTFKPYSLTIFRFNSKF